MARRLLRTGIELGVLALTVGCGVGAAGLGIWPPQPPFYCARPVAAEVRDASSGEPLEGVVVVAHWQLEPETSKQMAVMETVTDRDGRFAFPGWGPRWRPMWGYLAYAAPELVFFKPGYTIGALQNDAIGPSRRSPRGIRRRSDWDGRVIEVQPLDRTDDAYASGLNHIGTGVLRFAVGPECYWHETRALLRLLFEEVATLRARGLDRHRLFDRSVFDAYNADYEDECGSWDSYGAGTSE